MPWVWLPVHHLCFSFSLPFQGLHTAEIIYVWQNNHEQKVSEYCTIPYIWQFLSLQLIYGIKCGLYLLGELSLQHMVQVTSQLRFECNASCREWCILALQWQALVSILLLHPYSLTIFVETGHIQQNWHIVVRGLAAPSQQWPLAGCYLLDVDSQPY